MSPTLGCLAVVLLALAPSNTEAQFDGIRERAERSLEEHRAKADSLIQEEAAEAIDTTLDMAGRGVEAGITTAAELVDTVLNRIKNAASHVFEPDQADVEAFTDALASGSLVLRGIELLPDSRQLSPKSRRVLKDLAEAVRITAGTFLIEEYADSAGCAAAVKSQLVVAGIPGERLVAVFRGAGRIRAPAGEQAPESPNLPRIELTRVAS